MSPELEQTRSVATGSTPSPAERERIGRWLAKMEDCVRTRDFQGARKLFAPEAWGFGTRARMAAGRAELEEHQWRRVWESTREFTFRREEMRCFGGSEVLCVAITWESLDVGPDGSTSPRSGRATIVLSGGRRLEAMHSHFSLDP